MSSLQAAHRGYEYQDLMVAARSVDLLLGTLTSAIVDEKLVEDDRFDDLTTVDVQGRRDRIQFKHTEREGQALSLATFTSDSRQLRLDKLLSCAVADRDGSTSSATSTSFRVILRDTRPTSDLLLRHLKPAIRDPGPFLPEMTSHRMQFDANELWPVQERIAKESELAASPFSFLRNVSSVTRADVVWLCQRLVIEVEAPAMSGDLGVPGAAEAVLLNRAIQDIGAGQYPNAHRAPNDVAEALIRAVRMARQGSIQLSAGEILRRAGLRSDFGAVAHIDPVDPAIEVMRPLEVREIASVAIEMAQFAQPLIVEGPPGQGKSWTCKQLVDHLRDEGWLVAEHYCFLGAADNEREARVYTESIFGTLLGLIEDAEPLLVREQRPRYAANQSAIETAVNNSLQSRPERPVALIVDGLDHVSRVAPLSRASDPSRQLAEELAALIMPTGSVLIVLSQPGDHLAPLRNAGAGVVKIAGFSRGETAALVNRHGITKGETDSATSLDEVVNAVHLRSNGNALYATYLCRELLSRGDPAVDALATVNSLPAYDGTLEAYYEHLYQQLDDRAGSVADYLAFLDFEVTPHELGDIQPDRAHRVRDALNVLGPVVNIRAQGGGLRVYHESFSRFLATRIDGPAIRAINDRIGQWLAGKGLFADERAYRFLLSTLSRAGHHSKVLELVDTAFLANSVAAGFPASAILSNLAVAVRWAVQVRAWPTVVRCIELARGASTFEYERLDTVMVDFADVVIGVLGGEQFASRLLFEGQTVVPARTGLQICAALDKRGLPAPWEPYIDAFIKEDAMDNTTSYGYESDAGVYVAILRGRLRIRAMERTGSDESLDRLCGDSTTGWVGTLESLQRLVTYIDESGLPADEVARAVLDTQGATATFDVASRLARPASFALAVASQLRDTSDKDSSLFVKFRDLALRSDRSPGTARALLDLGAPIAAILWGQQQERRARLLQLTEEVQHPTDFDEAIDEWLDLCMLASIDDPIGLSAAEAAVIEGFWYRNWLRFTIHVARVEAAPEERRSDLALDAIRLLNVDTEPFAGKPRACDLYPVWKQVRETIRRAVDFLDDESWHEALNILAAMSDSISTSIHGEFGGPFAADDLLHLIVETGASVARRKGATDLIKTITDKDSADRFYSDLAMYRLIAARLALRCGDRDEAERRWVEASQMLSGYGYRKDRTIFEILDPLPELINADPRRGRVRVAAVQALAKRVPAHTDGKETHHAWSTWWKLLALADPAALASLAGPAMVSNCNLPSALHEKARDELWKAWHLEANPVLASLLRNTLDLTLKANDAAGLERLLDTANRPSGLDAQILSLADGRPSRYSVSNSDELLDRDSTLLNELNAIADRWGAAHIAPWMSFETSFIGTAEESRNASVSGKFRNMGTTSSTDFPPGALGLAHAARAWRRRPYDTTAPMWDVTKYVNAIGYRLVALIQEGREGDADLSLRSVAEADRFRFNQDLLQMLAEGLERLGHFRLAAVAHALVWTRSRGGGGWLTFGGKTGIEALRRALELDCDTTLTVIAEEIQRAITGGNLGVTQAIIYAFTLVELPAQEGTNALDIAFQCWDEAAAVIGARAPRVHVWDDPDEQYAPSSLDVGAPCLGDLDMAFSLATIAGVSNPGREQKRRSMLSVRMLLEYAPTLAGRALQTLLPSLSDPATLVWILRLVESSKARTPIVAQCGPALTELAASDLLTVRSLARRLAPAECVVGPPLTPPDAALLNGTNPPVNLWLPPGHRLKADESRDEKLAAELEKVAGTRIARGEMFLPRLRKAVLHRLQLAVDDKQFSKRLSWQGDAIGRGNGLPDAYLALEEAIESALQRTAAGGRLALLANGEGIVGHQWEDQFADAIMDDPLAPLDLEAVRHPRPPIPIPPGPDSPNWIDIIEHVSGSSDASSFDHTFFGHESKIMAGTKIQASDDCATMIGGRFNGWRIIGSEEQRTIIPSGHRDQHFCVHRYSGLEFRERNDKTGFQSPPLSSTDAPLWMLPLPPGPTASSIVSGQPLVGYDRHMSHYGDAAYGLGIPEQIMVPTGWLRMLWRLEPLAPYLLGNEQGEALALVTWRTEYERSNYHLPWPKTQGSAIVLRPDLLHELESRHGEWLTLRDVIAGPVGMIESAVS